MQSETNGAVEQAIRDSHLEWQVSAATLGPVSDSRSATVEAKPALRLLRLEAGGRAVRRIFVGSVTTPEMGSGDFPDLMSAVAFHRSRLSMSEQIEVAVVITAPIGSDADPTWVAATRRFESNEFIARVLVWRPSADRQACSETLATLLFGRLVNLRLPRSPSNTANLAPSSAVFEASGLDKVVADRWRDCALQTGLGPKECASRMLSALDQYEEAP